uniref:hypothetical protein n=1 Tax=Desulfonatronum thiodismutans TaxID=159290 RepID=UPI0004ABDAAD|nr:hypothetical protein [Desulfonatronum thiodismutans]
MQIKAHYSQGRLEFAVPLRLARDSFPVVVELPDSAVHSEETPSTSNNATLPPRPLGRELLEEFRKILGPFQAKRPAASVGEDRAAYIDALAEKYTK